MGVQEWVPKERVAPASRASECAVCDAGNSVVRQLVGKKKATCQVSDGYGTVINLRLGLRKADGQFKNTPTKNVGVSHEHIPRVDNTHTARSAFAYMRVGQG